MIALQKQSTDFAQHFFGSKLSCYGTGGIIHGSMPKLSDSIGHTILLRSIPVDEQKPTVVKLIDVETGGIWIESQDLTDPGWAK